MSRNDTKESFPVALYWTPKTPIAERMQRSLQSSLLPSEFENMGRAKITMQDGFLHLCLKGMPAEKNRLFK
jgi:hypothetical protein